MGEFGAWTKNSQKRNTILIVYIQRSTSKRGVMECAAVCSIGHLDSRLISALTIRSFLRFACHLCMHIAFQL
jgi:hypothetical protein